MVLVAIFVLNACMFSNKRVKGKGDITVESRNVSNATKIKVAGSMNVYLSEGPMAVKIEAQPNIIKYIVTDVENGWLELKTQDDIDLNTPEPVTIFVTIPSITAINVAGSGNVYGESKFISEKSLKMQIAGSGDINVDVNTPEVESNIAGSGNIKVSGETKEVNVNIAGAGNYNGANLKAENASVKITGSGDVEVFADVLLDAKIIGSGSIRYKGNARVDQKVVGSGDIKKLD